LPGRSSCPGGCSGHDEPRASLLGRRAIAERACGWPRRRPSPHDGHAGVSPTGFPVKRIVKRPCRAEVFSGCAATVWESEVPRERTVERTVAPDWLAYRAAAARLVRDALARRCGARARAALLAAFNLRFVVEGHGPPRRRGTDLWRPEIANHTLQRADCGERRPAVALLSEALRSARLDQVAEVPRGLRLAKCVRSDDADLLRDVEIAAQVAVFERAAGRTGCASPSGYGSSQ
jgi:hypothetical protein